MNDSVPDWFTNALATEPESHRVTVAGTSIHYLAWGERGRPGLICIHGGGAHAHWWAHVAPAFVPNYRVVALDLSGHGDSDRREHYTLDLWTDEVQAVSNDAGFASAPVLVGHSMGGFVTIAAAGRHPDAFAGAVIIDSPVVEVDPEVDHARRTDDFNRVRIYDDPAVPIGNFRTIPPQAVYLPYVIEHVARNSLRQRDDGRWEWKFDPSIFVPRRAEPSTYLSQIRCRVALLRCEHGLMTPDIGAYMYEQLGRLAPVIELPTAGHHPMLDVPLILITAIRSLLADWDHSTPLNG
jgi:pimeloyl-ACP methyl ester carboxylesterase